MTLTDQLRQNLRPGRILAVQVGINRTAVLAETDLGLTCGIAATIINPGLEYCRDFAIKSAGMLQSQSVSDLSALVDSDSFPEVSIGLAAINALLPKNPDQWVVLNADEYLIEHGAGKNIVVVGHFPFIPKLRSCAKNLWTLELNPLEDDLPADMAPEILPSADLVAITATTLINKTFDGLMALCRPDATVILVGPSTPLSPILYDFGIEVLSGTIVVDPQNTLLSIGQGATLRQLRQAGYVRLVTMKKGK
ncbi:MAG: DUF364 domain-containing protein [Anaerolineaceae bacterium]|nr:DUF364 domain-containing protein [Anaerolineaceae bacterium]